MRLNPAASASSSPIIIDMFVHGLNEPTVRYDALSYTWGDGTKNDAIIANGHPMNITKNLQAALQHLRRQDEEVLLWVDGICINQDNTDERNAQVAQMGKIFRKADQVRVWLGAESQTSGAAMRVLEGLDGVRSSEQIVHRLVADEDATQALTLLLQRPYWTRMWVFQETVLAREATIHCGSLSAKWSTLRALDDVTGNPAWWQDPKTRKPWITGLRKAVFRISQFFISLQDARSTINVLHSTRTLLSTDPRDKLFALIGVSDMSHLLKADYSKPTRDVYMDFTRRLIRKDRNLAILLTAGPWNPQNGADIGLPSWTPDYRGMSGVDVRYLAASHLEHFNASKGSYHNHPRSDSLSGPDTLMVEGVILDTVGKTAFLGTGESRRRSVMEKFDPVRRHPRPRANHSFKDFFETMILYSATVYGDRFAETTGFEKGNKSRLALGFLHDFNKFYRTQNPAARTGKHIDITSVLHGVRGAETFEQAVREYHDLRKTDPAALYWRRKEYVTRVEGATDGHLTNIFSTADGYLGRGLSFIREGDIVAVLSGSRLPFVLRKAEESSTYQLISPCYVPGVMSGELMERTDSDFQVVNRHSKTLAIG
ncbi:HET domain-containing protein [Colletotrichum higginsianum IMI 349063]|uniref:HET domain-containing protein n=2 Tax=Colletotrichum higginsianum (strain IMI 349063) TaxID=759273 RepID=A0A1B7YD26_COLHI|nr:HET domain-containing protein [Colletotrichum higginsianum IMI 349063]OBR09935.1 HET domain-containing protein [Colletotrichum higginsianum IMI 349063]